MKYTVKLEKAAQRDLRKLPPGVLKRLLQKLERLGEGLQGLNVKKLRGFEGYRLRVGDYRLLFTIDARGEVIYVYRLKHRREVYKT